MGNKLTLFWFRRDLRLDDNVGLLEALKGEYPVMPIFIFDRNILERLPKDDARVTFIHDTLRRMRSKIRKNQHSSLALYHGTPQEVFTRLIDTYEIAKVYTNHDYEPYALERDKNIGKILTDNGVDFLTFKDQVIFEKGEIVKSNGDPYVVYTPYKNRWKEKFNPQKDIKTAAVRKHFGNLIRQSELADLSLSEIGFKRSSITVPSWEVTPTLIENYEKTRNFPSKNYGTSRLGPHLRFGTVSIRKMIKKAIAENNEVFWNELIWREFFMQILWHFPHTVDKAFRPKYDRIEWRNNVEEFRRWCRGETGYALVDAGMRELNQTGYMHNRVRMLVASFLCKHLLIDWRWARPILLKSYWIMIRVPM